MNEVDRAIYKLQARRAAHAAELAAQPAGPDRVAELVAEHDRIVDEVRARADLVMPVGGQPVTPEPAQERPAWDKFVWTLQGDVNHGMNLSALLRLAIRQAGLANVLAAMRAIGGER